MVILSMVNLINLIEKPLQCIWDGFQWIYPTVALEQDDQIRIVEKCNSGKFERTCHYYWV